VSRPPFATSNLALHVGDDPAAVIENRARIAPLGGAGSHSHWAWLEQVHGTTVWTVDAPPRPHDVPPEADASVTTLVGTPLVVLTADCAPIAIADDDAVGVVHAGWGGLLAGVVEAAVGALRAIGRGRVRAVVGPCIRPAHYEFGRADLDRLVARFGPVVEARTHEGRPALDLPAAVRAAFAEVGVDVVDDTGHDTAADPGRWFSYRRDGITGRQALVVVKDGRSKR
jgi:YfiH family protein